MISHFWRRSSTRFTSAPERLARQSGVNRATTGSSAGRIVRPSLTGRFISRRSAQFGPQQVAAGGVRAELGVPIAV